MKTTNKSILFILVIALSVLSFASCEVKPEPPAQVLSPEEANRLEEEYESTRWEIINAALDIRDTREFWFSLDSLKKYIEYVEYEAEKRGRSNLGIRVYFAAYPDDSNYPQPGFSTVFMVPTARAESSGLQRGFFPMQEGNENLDSIPAFNYGHGGQPPNDYE